MAYQVTHYMSKEDIDPFVEPFIKYNCLFEIREREGGEVALFRPYYLVKPYLGMKKPKKEEEENG